MDCSCLGCCYRLADKLVHLGFDFDLDGLVDSLMGYLVDNSKDCLVDSSKDFDMDYRCCHVD